MSFTKFCRGCGQTLQSANESATGYIKPLKLSGIFSKGSVSNLLKKNLDEQAIFNNAFKNLNPQIKKHFPNTTSFPFHEKEIGRTDLLWCQRCHDLKFHSRIRPKELLQEPQTTLPDIISTVNNDKSTCLIIQVIDVTEVIFQDFVSATQYTHFPVFHLFTHADVLPPKKPYWLFPGLGISSKYAMLYTSHSFNLVDKLLGRINPLLCSRGHVYVVGEANSGKSTLLKTLAKRGNGVFNELLLDSFLPGTTQAIKGYPTQYFGSCFKQLSEGLIFDTPGYRGNLKSLLPWVDPKLLTSLVPKTRSRNKQLTSKPVQYRVRFGQSIILGGLVRVTPFEINEDGNHEVGKPIMFKKEDPSSTTIHFLFSTLKNKKTKGNTNNMKPLLIKLFTKLPAHITSITKLQSLENSTKNDNVPLVTHSPSPMHSSFTVSIKPTQLSENVFDPTSSGELVIHNFGFLSFSASRPMNLLVESVNPKAVNWRSAKPVVPKFNK
ncbi:GTPase like protein [Schizosaccharomyces pombe]